MRNFPTGLAISINSERKVLLMKKNTASNKQKDQTGLAALVCGLFALPLGVIGKAGTINRIID